MPLQKQKVLVPFGGGVDTKSAKHVVQPGALLRADDVKFAETGSVMKRERFEPIAMIDEGGATISDAPIRTIMAYQGSRPVALSNVRIYEKTNLGWKDKGRCQPVHVEERVVADEWATRTDRKRPAACVVGDYIVYVYDEAKYSVIHRLTGSVVVRGGSVPGAFNVRRMSATRALILTYDGAVFSGFYFDTTAPLALAALTASISAAAVGVYGSAFADTTNNRVYFAYSTPTTGTPRVAYFTATDTASTPLEVDATTFTITDIGVTATGATIIVAWSYGTTISYRGMNFGLTTFNYATTNPTGAPVQGTCFAGAGAGTGTGVDVYFNGPSTVASSSRAVYVFRAEDTVPATPSVVVYAYNAWMAGEPRIESGNIVSDSVRSTLVPLYYLGRATALTNDTLQRCYILTQTIGPPVAALYTGRLAYGLAPEPLTDYKATNFARTDSTQGSFEDGSVFYFPQFINNRNNDQVGLVVYTISTRRLGCLRAELGKSLLFSQGPMVWSYDGERAVENGFLMYPETPTAVATAVGAGSRPVGVYRWVAVYTWVDAQGQLHRSAPSLPTAELTLSTTLRGDVTVYSISATNKPNVKIEIYRTLAGGSIFYFVASVNNAANGASVTHQDEALDTAIRNNATLYTTGGVLSEDHPSPVQALAVSGARAFAYTGNNNLEYSKEQADDLAVAFSAFFSQKIDQGGTGKSVALESMDGAVVVLGSDGIQVLRGDGPAPNGAGGFAPAQLVATDDGIMEQDDASGQPAIPTALRTDAGVFYLGKRGVMILNRALQVQYIGAAVERYLRSYNATEGVDVVRFVLNSKEHQVICATTGGFLVYDYGNGQWSRWSLSAANLGIVDAEMVGDRLHAIVWNKTTNAFNSIIKLPDLEDRAGAPLGADESMVVETAWIKLDGLAGFQRLYYATILAEWRSSHTMQVRIYYDYDETAAATITNAATSGYSVGDRLQFRFHLGRKCQAVKLQITDLNPSGNKDSFRLFGVEFEIGVKGGHYRPVTTR